MTERAPSKTLAARPDHMTDSAYYEFDMFHDPALLAHENNPGDDLPEFRPDPEKPLRYHGGHVIGPDQVWLQW